MKPHSGSPLKSSKNDKHDLGLANWNTSTKISNRIDEQMLVKNGSNHVYWDEDWQQPAVTEKIANENVCLFDLTGSAAIYIGFPWATYIDLLRKGRRDSNKFQILDSALVEIERYINFKNSRYAHRVITCCQHIMALSHIGLFKKLFITDIFWSHKARGQDSAAGIRVFPFPLFPVINSCGALNSFLDLEDYSAVNQFIAQRSITCSFVGAKDLPGYISDIRSRISSQLAQKNTAHIQCRSQWHYQGEVYDKQILERVTSNTQMRSLGKEEEFKSIMSKSLFSLCPSGTGPNTIRLWESISFMAIPIILSNQWSPPGNIALWDKACIFFDEYGDLEELWQRLLEFSMDINFLKQKLSGLQDLRLLYNHKILSHDLIQLLLNPCIKLSSYEGARSDNTLYLSDGKDEDRYVSPQSGITSPSLVDRDLLFDSDKLHRTPFGYTQLSPYVNRFFGSSRVLIDSPPKTRSSPYVYISGMLTKAQAATADEIPISTIWHVSEEPLWDLLYNGRQEILFSLQKKEENISYSGYLSGLYDELSIPYFLLTSTKYIQRYVFSISRILKDYDEISLLEHWKNTRLKILAFCEYRKDAAWESKYQASNSTTPLLLCAYRTLICERLKSNCPLAYVQGKGWHLDQNYARQQLPDWHVNKMVHERQSLLSLAIENVAYKNYITEKPFDALAMVSIPVVYWASNSEGFNFFESEAVVNLHGMSVDQSVNAILDFKPSCQTAKAFLSSCRILQNTFSSSLKISESRRKVASRLRVDFHDKVGCL